MLFVYYLFPRDINALQHKMLVYFFFSAFSAALVCLPSATFAVVALISRTASLPRGGYSEKASTHIGLLGTSLTMAASPDLMNLGLSSVDLPVRRSTFSLISANLHAIPM